MKLSEIRQMVREELKNTKSKHTLREIIRGEVKAQFKLFEAFKKKTKKRETK